MDDSFQTLSSKKRRNTGRRLTHRRRRSTSLQDEVVIRPHSALSNLAYPSSETSVSARRQKLLQERRPHSSLGNEANDDSLSITCNVQTNYLNTLKIDKESFHTTNNQQILRKRRPSLTSNDIACQPERISSKHEPLLPRGNQRGSPTVRLQGNKPLRFPSTSKVFWACNRQQDQDIQNTNDSKVSVDYQSRLTNSDCKLTPTLKAPIPRLAFTHQDSSYLRVSPDGSLESRLKRTSISSPLSSSSELGFRERTNERGKVRSSSRQTFGAGVSPGTPQHGHCRGKPFQIFRRVSRTVRVIAGICLALKSYIKEGATDQWSWREMHLNLRADMEKKLAFDPITFSKLRVTRGSDKLKSILSLKPHERTREDLDVILALLRSNRAFEQYDKTVKYELAEVMGYQKFESRRILLKEGHVAACFYILLSGTCLINQKEVDPRTGQTFIRTIDEISSGDSFGENSLLHGCKRTVTVICKDEVEVLFINQEDFNRVIRDPMQRRREELVSFCDENNLQLNLDDEKVKGNPNAIFTQNFKEGAIICKDMYESEFLYVIKTGRCHVIAEVSQGCDDFKQRRDDDLKQTIYTDDWKEQAVLKRSIYALSNHDATRRGWSDHAIEELHRNSRELTGGNFIVNGLQVTTPQLEAEAAAEKEKVLAIPKTIFSEEDQLCITRQSQTDDEFLDSKDGVVRTWKRITVATTMVGDKERRRNRESMQLGKSKKLYVQLAQLNKGSLFGLESILNSQNIEQSVRLSLRSDGSEVILVSKAFFSSDANLSKVLTAASKTTIEYPTAQKILQIVRQQREWKTYKSAALERIYNRKKDKFFATRESSATNS